VALRITLSAREVESPQQLVFCGYFPCVAILVRWFAMVCWLEKDSEAFLISVLATAGKGVLLPCGSFTSYIATRQRGAGMLAFGIPMLLAYCGLFFETGQSRGGYDAVANQSLRSDA